MRILWGAKTSRTMRVVWALHELGLDYDHRPIESRSGETATDVYTDINPRQKIPCLQDGSLTLAESAGIVTYLGERYGPCTDGNELVPAPNTDERILSICVIRAVRRYRWRLSSKNSVSPPSKSSFKYS